MPGPKSLFRGKTREPLSLQLTPHGKSIEDRVMAKTGLSRGDLYELLLTRHGSSLGPADGIPAT